MNRKAQTKFHWFFSTSSFLKYLSGHRRVSVSLQTSLFCTLKSFHKTSFIINCNVFALIASEKSFKSLILNFCRRDSIFFNQTINLWVVFMDHASPGLFFSEFSQLQPPYGYLQSDPNAMTDCVCAKKNTPLWSFWCLLTCSIINPDDSSHRTGLETTTNVTSGSKHKQMDRGKKREKRTHSPTVMDSGRPDVGIIVESGVECTGGLDSILRQTRRETDNSLSAPFLYSAHATWLQWGLPAQSHMIGIFWLRQPSQTVSLLESELRSAALAISHRSCRVTLNRKHSRVLHGARWGKMKVKLNVRADTESTYISSDRRQTPSLKLEAAFGRKREVINTQQSWMDKCATESNICSRDW